MIQNFYTSFLLTDYSVELWLIARLPFMAQLINNLPAMPETWVGKIPWRRERLPTPVFWPGESQGQGSLVGCRLWGHTESDTTEVT